MKLKGKQLKRAIQYRNGDPLKRKVARLKHFIDKKIKVPHVKGAWGYVDVSNQMTQPLPATIDKDAWGKEFDTKALCDVFGVPYEIYESQQSKMNNL